MNLKEWVGRSETLDDVITPNPYAALSATLSTEQRESLRREALSAVYISASLPCISWNSPMGWPN